MWVPEVLAAFKFEAFFYFRIIGRDVRTARNKDFYYENRGEYEALRQNQRRGVRCLDSPDKDFDNQRENMCTPGKNSSAAADETGRPVCCDDCSRQAGFF